MDTDMAHARSNHCFLFCMLLAFVYGAAIFLIGFFPISSHNVDDAANDSRPAYLDELSLQPPQKLYGQTIMMLVDALRYDFPTSTTMPFAFGNACSRLKLHVHIPTVTMPRLKSLTTGTVSNFIDIVLNIGHVEQLSDSLLHRLREHKQVLVFAGDRTWTSLFPNKFQRQSPNIDSFFVQDFYEGDLNVTKVLAKELLRSDWTLLILHYLGLDHIGHVEGSESMKVPLKLREMDQVVHKIYKSNHFQNQLLLLTGDHGMRDGGGHGGSTTGEMYVPLLVFKQNCSVESDKTNEYSQIDLAPTLAILLAVEIPNVSIGCLIPELLQELSFEDQLYGYYYNALHLLRKASNKFGEHHMKRSEYTKWFDAAKDAHKRFLTTKNNSQFENAFLFEQAKLDYTRLSREISLQLSASLVHFNYGLIAIGISLTTLVTLYTFLIFIAANVTWQHIGRKVIYATITIATFINCWAHYMEYIKTSKQLHFILLLAIAASVYLAINMCRIILLACAHSWRQQERRMPWPLLTCLILQTLSLASSSFIEEEHQIWYYLGVSSLIALCLRYFYEQVRRQKELHSSTESVCAAVVEQLAKMRFTLLIITGFALLRRLSSATVLNHEDSKAWLSCILAGGLILLLLCLRRHTGLTQFFCSSVAIVSIYCFRGLSGVVCFYNVINLRESTVLTVFWLAVCTAAFIGFKTVLLASRKNKQTAQTRLAKCFEEVLTVLLLISALLHKPHNVVLVPYLLFTLSTTYDLCDRLERNGIGQRYTLYYVTLQKTIYTILVANMFYFYQGNSNSLATIDLNPGYIGQSSYNPLIVGFFVTLNMYCAPIISFLYLIVHMLSAPLNKTCNDAQAGDEQLELPKINEKIQLVIFFYTLRTLVPVAIYLWLLVFFRYHLFIYSVFAPKALYECYSVVVFFLVFILTYIKLYVFS